jgi:hypothetical protein
MPSQTVVSSRTLEPTVHPSTDLVYFFKPAPATNNRYSLLSNHCERPRDLASTRLLQKE